MNQKAIIHALLLSFSITISTLSCMEPEEMATQGHFTTNMYCTNRHPFSDVVSTENESLVSLEETTALFAEQPFSLSKEQKNELFKKEPNFFLLSRLALFVALDFLGNEAMAHNFKENPSAEEYRQELSVLRKIKFNTAFKQHNLYYSVTETSGFFSETLDNPLGIIDSLINALGPIKEKIIATALNPKRKEVLLLSPTNTKINAEDIYLLDKYLINSPKSPIQKFVKNNDDTYLITIGIKNPHDANTDIMCNVFLKKIL